MGDINKEEWQDMISTGYVQFGDEKCKKCKKKKKRGHIFTLESEKGEAVRIDEYGNKEYMVKGSGGSKWVDKETGAWS